MEPLKNVHEVRDEPLILSFGSKENGTTGTTMWMEAGQHPEECRIVQLWPGDYLNERGVRFPVMLEWDGDPGGFVEVDPLD